MYIIQMVVWAIGIFLVGVIVFRKCENEVVERL